MLQAKASFHLAVWPRDRARVLSLAALLAGCAGEPQGASRGPSVGAVAAELGAIGGATAAASPSTWSAIFADAIAKDAYVCLPSAREVFAGEGGEGVRRIRGVMPHYGAFLGPMQYTIEKRRGPSYRVSVRVAVTPPPPASELELPDCALAPELEGDVRCEGVPYARSGSIEACPGSGTFRAPATRRNVEALLARWSREAEGYFDRDAAAFGLPIDYDFEVTLDDGGRADMTVPLLPTCGRTPYFAAMRAGWSLPIVAHEIGHVMGLLDEYEALSGVVSFYPKTPFKGAEVSRMGLSMKEETRVLPLHHYLVLRRFFCPEPAAIEPFSAAVP